VIFAPELLARDIYYAQVAPDSNGELVELSDRYQQALLYKDLAHQCFIEATKRRQATAGAHLSV